MSRHKFFLQTTMIFLSIVVGLLIAELLLRWAKPAMTYTYMPQRIEVSYFRPSTLLPWELKPNDQSRFKMSEFDTTVTTNSLGLRDSEIDFSRPRVLCMGDSFTFGYGVENNESFCSTLETLFSGKYDFVNAGFADGGSPDTYAVWFTQYLESVDPLLVLISCSQNDLGDVGENTWIYGNESVSADDESLPQRIIVPGLLITPEGYALNGSALRNRAIASLHPELRKLLRDSYVVGLLRDRLARDKKEAESPSTTEKTKFLRSLGFLRKASNGRHIAFYIIPERGQAAPSEMDRLIDGYAKQFRIPVLSNYHEFSNEDYFALDGHWNRSGHRKAAEFLYQALSRLGL